MCRRKTKDPLFKFVSDRGYTMLRNMRTGVQPGQVWLEIDGRYDPVGHVNSLLADKLKLPKATDERLVGLNATRSHAVDAGIALDVLGPALLALGAPALLGEVKASISGMHDAAFRVELSNVIDRGIPIAEIAKGLPASRLDTSVTKTLVRARRIAIATNVMLANGLVLEATTKAGGALALKVGAKLLGSVGGGVTVEKRNDSTLSFAANTPIAVAVRLYNLVYNTSDSSMWFDKYEGNAVLEGRSPAPPPVLYLDGVDGELFADLPGSP
jgi:hypothetical protein